MTMIPSPHDDIILCRQPRHTAGGYGGEIDLLRRRFRGFYHHQSLTQTPCPSSSAVFCNLESDDSTVFSDNHYFSATEMADDRDESRAENNHNQPSSSRVDENWLRLGLGGSSEGDDMSQQRRHEKRGLVELDLLPGTSGDFQQQQQVNRRSTGTPPAFFNAPEFRAPHPVAAWLQNPAADINWGLMRPSNLMGQQQFGNNYFMANNPGMTLMPMGPFFAMPYGSSQIGLNGGDTSGATSSSGGGMRIISPPRRPHVGVWFMLQASQNQVREPILPQIPKNYIRIKDGRMTVRLLMKYLVHKLRLESESEVEIRCRGQELQPVLTLQHVRDNIWSRSDGPPLTLLTDTSLSTSLTTLKSPSLSSAAVDSHVMILHYARPVSTTTTTTSSYVAPIFSAS